jgi:hypothetical protein
MAPPRLLLTLRLLEGAGRALGGDIPNLGDVELVAGRTAIDCYDPPQEWVSARVHRPGVGERAVQVLL